MRIGQYTDTFLPVVDGVGRVVVSYAQTMGEMGHDVTVIAPHTDMGDISALPYHVQTYGTVPLPGKMPYRIGFPQLDIQFHQWQREMMLDIIHVHSPFMSGSAGVHSAKKRNVPVVGSFHSKYYDDFAQVLKSDTLAKTGVKYVVDFYHQCDEVWAVSGATAKTLKEYGFTGEVIVMPNGTDIRTLDTTVLPELRQHFGLQSDAPVLLYVGQLNWKKNIRHILQAVAKVKDAGQRFRLLLAGQGPHREEIEKEGLALGLAEAMTFVGHVESTRTLDGLYALADLFVFPSLYDNAPMVLREAAVMGTPAVLTAGSSSAEGITDGYNGLLSEDNPEALAQAILRGLSSQERLREMGEMARQTIPVSWQTLMHQVITRYEALVRNKKGTFTEM